MDGYKQEGEKAETHLAEQLNEPSRERAKVGASHESISSGTEVACGLEDEKAGVK